jgi:hypothetical protein
VTNSTMSGAELSMTGLRRVRSRTTGKHPPMLSVGEPTLAGQLEDVGIQRGEEDHAPRRRIEEGPSGRRDRVEAAEVVKDLLAAVTGGLLDGG